MEKNTVNVLFFLACPMNWHKMELPLHVNCLTLKYKR